MKRNLMMICIAAAALLLCTESIQAQSRVVRRVDNERGRRNERVERPVPPRRQEQPPVVVEQRRPVIKVVDNEVIRAFDREHFDSDRLKMADMVFNTGGLMTVAQISRISAAFDFDSNRVKFIKKAYLNCVDPYNYYMVLGTLDYSSSREKIIDYVINTKEELRFAEPVRKVSSSDMNAIIKALKNESYDSTRSKIAKMIVRGSMLTSRQIADMGKTFTYDSNRYKFLLYAYDSCIDPQNYTIAANTLEFNTNRSDLMRNISRR